MLGRSPKSCALYLLESQLLISILWAGGCGCANWVRSKISLSAYLYPQWDVWDALVLSNYSFNSVNQLLQYLETLQWTNYMECGDFHLLVYKFFSEWLITNVICSVECHTDCTMWLDQTFWNAGYFSKHNRK